MPAVNAHFLEFDSLSPRDTILQSGVLLRLAGHYRAKNRLIMRVSRVITAAVLSLTLSTSALAVGPLTPLNVGNWHVGSYTNDQTGKFNHCAVNASYNGGINFFVSVGNAYGWAKYST